MSEGKDADRARRKRRRGQLDHEKGRRRAEQSRTAHLESKANDAKVKLDLRIDKLVDEGYSVESVAKRMGLSMRRINAALDANRRRGTLAQAEYMEPGISGVTTCSVFTPTPHGHSSPRCNVAFGKPNRE